MGVEDARDELEMNLKIVGFEAPHFAVVGAVVHFSQAPALVQFIAFELQLALGFAVGSRHEFRGLQETEQVLVNRPEVTVA